MHVKVRVRAGAKHESVERKGTVLAVAVKEKAEGNRANAKVREIVAREYGVKLSAVRIISGHRAPSKLFLIIGLSEER